MADITGAITSLPSEDNVLTGDVTLTLAADANITYADDLTQTDGENNRLTVNTAADSTATLTLTGTNTQSGLTIGAGVTIVYQADTALGNKSTDSNNAIILNGGTLDFKASGTTDQTVATALGITVNAAEGSTITNSSAKSGTTDAASLRIDGPITKGTNDLTFAGLGIDGQTLNVINLSNDSSVTHAGAGDVTVNRGVTLNVPHDFPVGEMTVNGDLRGNGDLTGNVVIGATGRLLPGSSVGTSLDITGNLEMRPKSSFWISNDGDTSGDFDVLNVSGTTKLGINADDTYTSTEADKVAFYNIPLQGNSADLPGSVAINIIVSTGTLNASLAGGSDVTAIKAVNYIRTQISEDQTNATDTARVGAYSLSAASNTLTLTRA